ncbi:hypothetical protein V8F06_009084 [Rhypophila decipiens]
MCARWRLGSWLSWMSGVLVICSVSRGNGIGHFADVEYATRSGQGTKLNTGDMPSRSSRSRRPLLFPSPPVLSILGLFGRISVILVEVVLMFAFAVPISTFSRYFMLEGLFLLPIPVPFVYAIPGHTLVTFLVKSVFLSVNPAPALAKHTYVFRLQTRQLLRQVFPSKLFTTASTRSAKSH